MARRRIGLAIRLQVGCQPGQRATAYRNEQRIAESSQHWERVLAGAGNADRWMRLLIRPRHRARRIELPVLAVVGKALLRPGLLQDVQRLIKPLAALGVGHTVSGVATRIAAASGP